MTSASPLTPPTRGADLVRSVLGELDGEHTTAVLSVEAPVTQPERLLALGDGDAFVWRPPRGPAFAGVGACRRVVADGPLRFEAVEAQARALLGATSTRGAADAPMPRLFGGFAFAPGSASTAPWEAFGDASFTLPRIAYATEGDRAWLSLALTGGEAGSTTEVERWAGFLHQALDALVRPGTTSPRSTVAAATTLSRAAWRATVESIRTEIAAGRAEKIVAARMATHALDREVDIAALCGRLAEGAPSCATFAFVRGGATFVGASPETLVSRRGAVAFTEALAGSLAPGHDETSLLASEKDRAEHSYVVSEIVRTLRDLALDVEPPPEPQVRRFPTVVHLRTPVRAHLDRDVHVLRIAAALHPTPAVAGVPKAQAVEWIARHEAAPRGWYAGPVGWVDGAGDGDLFVALRSGLLTATSARLYAGAGIVAASEPELEYAETELKFRALRGALGVEA